MTETANILHNATEYSLVLMVRLGVERPLTMVCRWRGRALKSGE